MKDISLQQALHLLDKVPQPMLLLENTGTVRSFNQAFGTLVGVDWDSSADLALDAGLLQPLLGNSTVINWIMPDGDERWLAIEAVEIPDMPGTQARFYTDITEKLRLRHERDALQHDLDEQTLYDARINSLLSRRGILVSLAPLVARCRRYNNPLSVIALSISSDATDRSSVLADITALLRDQTRWADLVGLNDSEAFIMVLQETTRDAALQLVEKLAARIDRMNDGDVRSFAACYGITECQNHDDAHSLLERAEQALIEAGHSDSGRTVAL
ncbi:MAG: diguanylate cyclase [Gammaproteobacteria bacterium]